MLEHKLLALGLACGLALGGLTSIAHAANTYPQLYRQGLTLAQEGQWQHAYNVWKQIFIDGASTLSSAQRAKLACCMAKAAIKLNKPALARKCVAAARKLQPESPAVEKLSAFLEKNTRNQNTKVSTDDFSATYDNALERLSYGLLREEMVSGDGQEILSEVASVFSQAVAKSYCLESSLLGHGCCQLYGNANVKEARNILQRGIELAPNDARYYVHIACIERKTGNLSCEIANLEKCQALGYSKPSVLRHLTVAYGRRCTQNDRRLAMACVQELVAQDPHAAEGISSHFSDVWLRESVDRLVNGKLKQESARREAEELKYLAKRASAQREREQIQRKDAKAKAQADAEVMRKEKKGQRSFRKLHNLAVKMRVHRKRTRS